MLLHFNYPLPTLQAWLLWHCTAYHGVICSLAVLRVLLWLSTKIDLFDGSSSAGNHHHSSVTVGEIQHTQVQTSSCWLVFLLMCPIHYSFMTLQWKSYKQTDSFMETWDTWWNKEIIWWDIHYFISYRCVLNLWTIWYHPSCALYTHRGLWLCHHSSLPGLAHPHGGTVCSWSTIVCCQGPRKVLPRKMWSLGKWLVVFQFDLVCCQYEMNRI